jgi:hypothetical protein
MGFKPLPVVTGLAKPGLLGLGSGDVAAAPVHSQNS